MSHRLRGQSNASDNLKRIVVGICGMRKKIESKYAKKILQRLERFNARIQVRVFAESIILNESIETWPECNCFLAFHSKGFPLEKAIAYVRLRQPALVINDLEKQVDLLDRSKVYDLLANYSIPTPSHAVLRRGGGERRTPDVENGDCGEDASEEETFIEDEDQVTVNGVVFQKPFVEKPLCAELHDIRFYYPTSAGGGSQRLFRKTKTCSSVYDPECSRVRRDGSYMYEEFLEAGGTDVKVYAVGQYYAHAEARKAPGLDGKVERDKEGKEIRYPIMLTNEEKLIARKIVLATKQTVCGFDILRSGGRSVVCDVNGFSFVKSSEKYYDDAAKILGNLIMCRVAPKLGIPIPESMRFQLDDPPLAPTTHGQMMELRCVLAVIRHGDRTPKQKMKMQVFHRRFHELFVKYGGDRTGELKFKKPEQLQAVLDIARSLLKESEEQSVATAQQTVFEDVRKLEQLKIVLEMYGYFSGINRKVQLKSLNTMAPLSPPAAGASRSLRPLLLIVKWGGELTPAGVTQAVELAKAFRRLYPGAELSDDDEKTGTSRESLGFLRLHNTYRHDLKIYASEEGRVQMTAAAFAKGLLQLEGELTPILVHMVKSANTNGLLDDDREAARYQETLKDFLHACLQQDTDFTEEEMERLNPLHSRSVQNALEFVKNPRRMCEQIYALMTRLCAELALKRHAAKMHQPGLSAVPTTRPPLRLYENESWQIAENRWLKLLKDFRYIDGDDASAEAVYDISKIPDIYDCVKFDLQHNEKTIGFDGLHELFVCSKHMADIVVPQEYGITQSDKLAVGQGICTPLLLKLREDLHRCVESGPEDEALARLEPRATADGRPFRHVHTRLYFTSESHIHSLMNLIKYGELVTDSNDRQWARALRFLSSVSEYSYLSQLVIMLYENSLADSAERFHVELHFSPGSLPPIETLPAFSIGYRPKSPQLRRLSPGRPIGDGGAAKVQHAHSKLSAQRSSGSDDGSDHPFAAEDVYITVKSAADFFKRANMKPTPISIPTSASTSGPWSARERAATATAVADEHEQTESSPPPFNSYNANLTTVVGQSAARSVNQRTRSLSGNYATAAATAGDQSSSGILSTPTNPSSSASSPGRPSSRCEAVEDEVLISTQVIRGCWSAEALSNGLPALHTTAVVSASDESFRVPPLRSLETLHNQLSYLQVDDFLRYITTRKTPIPSPPRRGSELPHPIPVAAFTARQSSAPGASTSGIPTIDLDLVLEKLTQLSTTTNNNNNNNKNES